MLPTEMVHAIEAAIRDRVVLRVTYQAVDGTVGVIEIEPLAIRFNRSGHRVLWCRRHDTENVEELLWDGIQAAAPTGDIFNPRPWIDPQT